MESGFLGGGVTLDFGGATDDHHADLTKFFGIISL